MTAKTLWMGDLESYMDEMFISSAFAAMGETVARVKLMKHKTLGTNMYGFVEFEDSDGADNALQKLNGMPVPGTNPIKKFKLNNAVYGKDLSLGPEHSLYVGDMTQNVSDSMLLEFFQTQYKSVKAAKVVCDATGKSKRYGFVRFYDESEYQRALQEMQGAVGLGDKPIKVNAAVQKGKSRMSNDAASNAQYYQQYQQQYQQYMQSYYQPNNAYQHQPMYAGRYQQQQQYGQQYGQQYQAMNPDQEPEEDPTLDLDVGEVNRQWMSTEKRLFFELEEARWNPLESYASVVPTPKVLT